MATQAAIRFGVFNPASILAERADEVSRILRGVDLLALPGTKLKKPGEKVHFVRCHANHFSVNWGYATGPFTNRSAGCSIFLKKGKYRQSRITRIQQPPPGLQGRGGTITYAQGDTVIKVIVAYFPPPPANRSERASWAICCNKLADWIDYECAVTPQRETLLIGTDANDNLGMINGQPNIDEAGCRASTGRR